MLCAHCGNSDRDYFLIVSFLKETNETIRALSFRMENEVPIGLASTKYTRVKERRKMKTKKQEW